MTAPGSRPPRRGAPRRTTAKRARSQGQAWTSESAAAIFDEFMAAMPAVAFVKDATGRYLHANRQLVEQFSEHLLGSDWFGKTDAEIWPPDVAALVRASDAAALAADAPVQTTQLLPIGDGHVPLLVTTFPIHTAQGTFLGGIGLDITRERTLAGVAARRAHERVLVANTLANLPAGATSTATAQMVCRQVVGLAGVVSAAIMRFAADGRPWPIGFAVANGSCPDVPPGAYRRGRRFRARAAQGAWIEAWVHRPWRPHDIMLDELGVRAHAYVPIHHGGTLIGVLAVGSSEEAGAVGLAESMAALVEFAGLAGILIGPDLAGEAEFTTARQRIVDILDRLAFRPVFQPIVDLERQRVVGYEALTRFEDGTAPDEHFAAAEAVGLGPELEAATLRAVVVAAGHLGPSMLLNLNASPALVLEGTVIQALIKGIRQRVVLEITEHTAIADYAAFHRAVEALGPSVRLAVDDAGAGFSSFRHILELRPAFVKLDRSIVVGIDRNLAKQALVAGMRQFARSTGSELIAEGIETETERAALVRLGVRLAQGYLLGRPGPLPD